MKLAILQKSDNTIYQTILQDKSLSFFQKIILVTDGTVTDLLGLYTGQSIYVKKLDQEISIGGQGEVYLCTPGTPLLKRSVLIRSKIENYVYAESTFIFENLSRSTQYKLLETDQPIGQIWKEEKLESYRKIIAYNKEFSERVATFFNLPRESKIVSRTYLIFHNKTVLGTITEKFPMNNFKKNV